MRLRLLALLAALAFAPAAASASAAPQVEARAWFVQNGATGEVLVAHAARTPLPVASITKLMTVLVALERVRASDVVVVSPLAAGVGESTIHLVAGERVTVEDLVEAALIQSANDAAQALAVHVGGGSVERFVELMNAKARRLGMTGTRFVNPSGLDAPGGVSTARDVTLLGRVAMRHPVVRRVVARRSDEAAGRTLATWNDLLGTFPGLVGVKTGHTAGAGWSQVAAARGPGTTIYATILGSRTRAARNEDLAELLTWGLAQYRVVEAIDARRVYATASAPYGRPSIRLVAAEPFRRSVRVGRPLVERVVAPEVVTLPIRKGQRLGEVRVFLAGELLATRPLVAADAASAPGTGGKARWYATRAWERVKGWFS